MWDSISTVFSYLNIALLLNKINELSKLSNLVFVRVESIPIIAHKRYKIHSKSYKSIFLVSYLSNVMYART